MSWNHCPRVRFTPQLWEKWQQRQVVDEKTLRLREGIAQFRRALNAKDANRLDVLPPVRKP
jgi:hypothetical protein